MFPQSSQKKYWIFSDENDLTTLREKTNADFIAKHGVNMTVSLFLQYSVICYSLFSNHISIHSLLHILIILHIKSNINIDA
jgi:hypothetical protein